MRLTDASEVSMPSFYLASFCGLILAILVFVVHSRKTLPIHINASPARSFSYTGKAKEDEINQLVEGCVKGHSKCLATVEQDGSEAFAKLVRSNSFGVIDVREKRLVRLDSENTPYAALSYVWGATGLSGHNTTRANVLARRNVGQLKIDQMPQTISDAILLVKGLGINYLWVDALCIVQDSPTSWRTVATAMDLIYGHAKFTICAADGESSSSGLHVLHADLSFANQELRAKNAVETSTWNQRAWTFQERILSRRCLIFAGGNFSLECPSSTGLEDCSASCISTGNSSFASLKDLEERPILFYTNGVSSYSGRHLTLTKDILNAFSGASRLMERAMGTDFFFGLPISYFELALLWRPVAGKRRRLRKAHENWDDDMEFPSWSWAGWEDAQNPGNGTGVYYDGQLLYDPDTTVNDWLHNDNWIDWHARDSKGDLQALSDHIYELQPVQTQRLKDGWKGYSPPKVKAEQGVDGFGRPLRQSTKNAKEWTKLLPDTPFGIHIHQCAKDCGREVGSCPPLQPILQFFTWHCSFEIRIDRTWDGPGSRAGLARCHVVWNNAWCGTVKVDTAWAEKRQGTECEFIALSTFKRLDGDEARSRESFEGIRRERNDSSVYFVMLVEENKDRFVRERIGIGKVLAGAVNERGAWMEVILG